MPWSVAINDDGAALVQPSNIEFRVDAQPEAFSYTWSLPSNEF